MENYMRNRLKKEKEGKSKKVELNKIKEEIENRIPVEGDKDYINLLKYLKQFIPNEIYSLYKEVIRQSKIYEKPGNIGNKNYEKLRDSLFNKIGFGTGYNEYVETNWCFFSDDMNLKRENNKFKFCLSNLVCTCEESRVEWQNNINNEECEEKIVPAKTLPKGWNWIKYDDNSGYLESPTKEEYMFYDLNTYEYLETIDSEDYRYPPAYPFFGDSGLHVSEFDYFGYLEAEARKKYLEKDTDDILL